ncbi:hypothetical protein C900_03467 [Fulvivirga imtechensis AK7]|uniref:Uncharacterized protein n=1 Tax=Fulvivirga imtechensis AK7 TaxID=1237149 RepID=L8JT79_9BACT|nr:hypothetical protein C900_03467 [Fulvivirga imtechensis AK7]
MQGHFILTLLLGFSIIRAPVAYLQTKSRDTALPSTANLNIYCCPNTHKYLFAKNF